MSGVSLPAAGANSSSASNAAVENSGKFFPLDVNIASRRDLETLPGVGPVLAERIIQYRDEYGPFENINDLKKVKGIGTQKAGDISGFVSF